MTSLFNVTVPARYLLTLCFSIACLMGSVVAHAQPLPAQSRGQLLYTTHCITCHTSEMHWRNNRKASDWDSLKGQVRLWQGNTGLQWDEADISAVTGYLNDTIYQFPQAVTRVGPVTGPDLHRVATTFGQVRARP